MNKQISMKKQDNKMYMLFTKFLLSSVISMFVNVIVNAFKIMFIKNIMKKLFIDSKFEKLIKVKIDNSSINKKNLNFRKSEFCKAYCRLIIDKMNTNIIFNIKEYFTLKKYVPRNVKNINKVIIIAFPKNINL